MDTLLSPSLIFGMKQLEEEGRKKKRRGTRRREWT